MSKVATPASMGISEGSILMEKYRVERVVGQGGMGVVALATHLALGEQVAIKFLRNDTVADEAALRRFLREAQAAARLQCAHVARVSDVGIVDNDGTPFMVMEFLEGEDLGAMLEKRTSLHPKFAIDLALQACVALAEAHSWDVVHRDIKPTNLFITTHADGSSLLKVLDFGISKVATGGDELSLTSTQSLLGTPAYMSPEQMRSARDVDARSDIWSLGTVLYEMVQGNRPFYAETYAEMCVRVIGEAPKPLTVVLPVGLPAVILRCLEKKPAQRYQSIRELAAALAPLASDHVRASAMLAEIRRNPAKRENSAHITPVAGLAMMKQAIKLRPSVGRGSGDFSEQSTDIDTAALSDATPPPTPMSTLVVKRAGRSSMANRPLTSAPRRRTGWIIAGAAIAAAAGAGIVLALGGGGVAPDAKVDAKVIAPVAPTAVVVGGSAAAPPTAGSATPVATSGSAAAVNVVETGSGSATGSATSSKPAAGKVGGKSGGKVGGKQPKPEADLLGGRGPTLPPK